MDSYEFDSVEIFQGVFLPETANFNSNVLDSYLAQFSRYQA